MIAVFNFNRNNYYRLGRENWWSLGHIAKHQSKF